MAWTKVGTLATTELPGVIKMWGGTTAPDGYLVCDGSAVSRTDFAALFAAIGTTHGAGDGSSTFNLPNLTGKFPMGNTAAATGGATTHTHAAGTLVTAAHTHTHAHTHPSAAHSHSSAAHTHPLSAAAWANIAISGAGNVFFRNEGSGSFTSQFEVLNIGSRVAQASVAGSPTSLDGVTDSTTPGSTGSTTPGDTGAASTSTTSTASSTAIAGTSGAGSSLPPYYGLPFIIKT